MKFRFIAGFLFCTRHFTSYQGCRFLLHSDRSLIQTGMYKGVIAGKKDIAMPLHFLGVFFSPPLTCCLLDETFVQDTSKQYLDMFLKIALNAQECKLWRTLNYANIYNAF